MVAAQRGLRRAGWNGARPPNLPRLSRFTAFFRVYAGVENKVLDRRSHSRNAFEPGQGAPQRERPSSHSVTQAPPRQAVQATYSASTSPEGSSSPKMRPRARSSSSSPSELGQQPLGVGQRLQFARARSRRWRRADRAWDPRCGAPWPARASPAVGDFSSASTQRVSRGGRHDQVDRPVEQLARAQPRQAPQTRFPCNRRL